MIRNLSASHATRLTLVGALALALVAAAGSAHLETAFARDAKSEGAKAAKRANRAVVAAEEAVARNPRNAQARAALGSAYLEAGRFVSAATTFQDAVALGDSSPATALRLALAQIGSGRNRDAVVVLDQNRDGIAAGDLGLALALAGETGRGVEVLSDAIRGGENTPKLRQNLAYAFALDGRWREARLMAGQDVPADQIDDRISAWAMSNAPEAFQVRVANLLGAPLRVDAGQPAQLALGAEQPAEAAPRLAAVTPSGELPATPETASPAVASDPSQEYAAPPEPAVVPAPVPMVAAAAPAPSVSASSTFDAAFAAPPPAVFQPSAPAAARVAAPVPHVRAARAKPAITAAAFKPLANGSHRIQLGSFSSPENAKRAVKIYQARHPELRNFALTVTPAVVNGKNFWRVSASGYSRQLAFSMCSTVRTRGGGCFAYSAKYTLPGTLPASKGGPLFARR